MTQIVLTGEDKAHRVLRKLHAITALCTLRKIDSEIISLSLSFFFLQLSHGTRTLDFTVLPRQSKNREIQILFSIKLIVLYSRGNLNPVERIYSVLTVTAFTNLEELCLSTSLHSHPSNTPPCRSKLPFFPLFHVTVYT